MSQDFDMKILPETNGWMGGRKSDYITFLIRFYSCLEFLPDVNIHFHENNSKPGRVVQPVIPAHTLR